MITSVKQQSPQELLHCDISLKAVRNKGHILVTGRSKDYLMSSYYWESFYGTDCPRAAIGGTIKHFSTLHEERYFYLLQLLLFTTVCGLYAI